MTSARKQGLRGAARRAIVRSFEESLDKHADRTADVICSAIGAYGDRITEIRADVVAHTRLNFLILARVLDEGRMVTPDDLSHTRVHAGRRFRSGIGLKDFLHGYWTGHRVMWDAFDEAAGDDPPAQAALLDIHRAVMQFMEVASTVAAETYVQAQETLTGESERLRRDVLEDLLAAREVASGRKSAIAQAAGLGSEDGVIVLVAVPATRTISHDLLRSAGLVLTNVIQNPAQPLAVVRHDELVIVNAMTQPRLDAVAKDLVAAHTQLAHDGCELTIGVSTVHDVWGNVPTAYDEARSAIDRIGGQCEILPLSTLSVFDYLTIGADRTASRLIPPNIRSFVKDDLADGGELVKTLLTYADCELNATAAAERLFVHVNTVRYRLSSIAERSEHDPRTLDDLMELVLAIRLIQDDAHRS